MKLKTFLIIIAIVSCSFGVMALLAPAAVMSLYEVQPNAVISMLARYSGLGSEEHITGKHNNYSINNKDKL